MELQNTFQNAYLHNCGYAYPPNYASIIYLLYSFQFYALFSNFLIRSRPHTSSLFSVHTQQQFPHKLHRKACLFHVRPFNLKTWVCHPSQFPRRFPIPLEYGMHATFFPRQETMQMFGREVDGDEPPASLAIAKWGVKCYLFILVTTVHLEIRFLRRRFMNSRLAKFPDYFRAICSVCGFLREDLVVWLLRCELMRLDCFGGWLKRLGFSLWVLSICKL